MFIYRRVHPASVAQPVGFRLHAPPGKQSHSICMPMKLKKISVAAHTFAWQEHIQQFICAKMISLTRILVALIYGQG
jgi:hypothetical protein